MPFIKSFFKSQRQCHIQSKKTKKKFYRWSAFKFRLLQLQLQTRWVYTRFFAFRISSKPRFFVKEIVYVPPLARTLYDVKNRIIAVAKNQLKYPNKHRNPKSPKIWKYRDPNATLTFNISITWRGKWVNVKSVCSILWRGENDSEIGHLDLIVETVITQSLHREVTKWWSSESHYVTI